MADLHGKTREKPEKQHDAEGIDRRAVGISRQGGHEDREQVDRQHAGKNMRCRKTPAHAAEIRPDKVCMVNAGEKSGKREHGKHVDGSISAATDTGWTRFISAVGLNSFQDNPSIGSDSSGAKLLSEFPDRGRSSSSLFILLIAFCSSSFRSLNDRLPVLFRLFL